MNYPYKWDIWRKLDGRDDFDDSDEEEEDWEGDDRYIDWMDAEIMYERYMYE